MAVSEELRNKIVSEYKTHYEADMNELAKKIETKCDYVKYPIYIDGVMDWVIYSKATKKFDKLEIRVAEGKITQSLFGDTAVYGDKFRVEIVEI